MISIDTETNGKDVRDGRGYAMGVSVGFRHDRDVTSFYLPFRHTNLAGGFNYTSDGFMPLLQRIIDQSLIVYHNAKFDIVSLRTLGLHADGAERRYVDTMVLSHLLDETRPWTGKSLDSCSRYYLKDEGGKRKSEELKQAIKCFGWGAISPEIMAPYGAYDADLTLRLFEALQPKLSAEGLGEIWPHKKEFLELLIEMEGYGINVDTDLCRRMSDIGHAKMAEIQQILGVNPGSPIGLAQILNTDLGIPPCISPKTGRPTFDKEAMKTWYEPILEGMKGNKTATLILEYRGWQKSVTSNYESYLKHLSPDGRLRPNYLMHGTITGRLSCREPNLQQIPKAGDKPWNGKMKACFIPAPGYKLVSVDYSQLELRLATAVSQEPELIKVFQENRDIFTEMSQALGMSRNDTKTFVYSTQYGAGLRRISNVFGVTSQEASQMRERYYKAYPLFRRASSKAQMAVERSGRLRLWSGRYRHFLSPNSEGHKAFNSYCQGGGADIVERSMVRLKRDGIVDSENCRLLLQIHDEVVAEVREDKVEEYKKAISDSMANVDFDPMLKRVKFAAEAKMWGEK